MTENTFKTMGINRLIAVFGRRGAGKSNFLRYIARNWHAEPPYPDKVLLIDDVTFSEGASFPADRIVGEVPPLEEIRGKYSLVILDEAQDWLPNPGKPNATAMNLVLKGRHYGMTVIVATQTPGAIHTRVRSNVNKLFIFSLIADNDLAWVTRRDSRLAVHRDYLIQAKAGQALVWDGDDYDNTIKTLQVPLAKAVDAPKKRWKLFG